jgi:hypothetical protein
LLFDEIEEGLPFAGVSKNLRGPPDPERGLARLDFDVGRRLRRRRRVGIGDPRRGGRVADVVRHQLRAVRLIHHREPAPPNLFRTRKPECRQIDVDAEKGKRVLGSHRIRRHEGTDYGDK